MRTADAIALVGVLLVAWLVYRAHMKDPEFDFFDIFKEGGKVSKWSCMALGAFSALTYVFIGMYRDGKMTEGVMLAYGGLCFAPLVAKMFSTPSSTTTVSTSSTTEVTQEKKS